MVSELRYPAAPAKGDLGSAVDFARKVREGGGDLSTHEVAARLGYKSVENGAYRGRLTAVKMYGLVDGRGRLRVTELANRIIQPERPDVRQAALIEAFENVPLFKAFLDEFHGQSLDGLDGASALMNRWGVKEAKAGLAFATLRKSAEQAGLFSTAPDKMIRPTIRLGANPPVPKQEKEEQPERMIQMPQVVTPPVPQDPPAIPKLVEGALELLPSREDGWTDEGLEEFVELFRMILRNVYGLSSPSQKGGTVSSSNGHLPVLAQQ